MALGLTAVLSLGSPVAPRPRNEATTTPARAPAYAPSHLTAALCPRGSMPDGDACVHLESENEGDQGEGAPEPETSVNTHRDSVGRWVVYDEIPRRPDRPADYEAYRYPVPCEPNACVVSGYDLDRSDDQQRRGARLRQVGHGAVDLLEPRGTPISVVALEHQEGSAEVVYVGLLFGTTRPVDCATICCSSGTWTRRRRALRPGSRFARATSSVRWATRARLDACTYTSKRAACATGSTRRSSPPRHWRMARAASSAIRATCFPGAKLPRLACYEACAPCSHAQTWDRHSCHTPQQQVSLTAPRRRRPIRGRPSGTR
jgi:hypothetical protein